MTIRYKRFGIGPLKSLLFNQKRSPNPPDSIYRNCTFTTVKHTSFKLEKNLNETHKKTSWFVFTCPTITNSVLVEINRHFRGKNILALNAVFPCCLPGITPFFGSSLNIFMSEVVN